MGDGEGAVGNGTVGGWDRSRTDLQEVDAEVRHGRGRERDRHGEGVGSVSKDLPGSHSDRFLGSPSLTLLHGSPGPTGTRGVGYRATRSRCHPPSLTVYPRGVARASGPTTGSFSVRRPGDPLSPPAAESTRVADGGETGGGTVGGQPGLSVRRRKGDRVRESSGCLWTDVGGGGGSVVVWD